ncbi:EF-hand domain-containing protein [Pontibaca salina]|uniref:EF-hand domain-containing protein n=1 Tax=Pontibaca salina TaxID=2795731 RepID=A0A934HU24_9RHOB|nr:EF-hand domain-containing protein [Pontibaca salina]MBI6630785.1 EF-hand domain-containing protein [Pontibaca salina]
MTNSKILPGTFVAVTALLSGLTVATAQTSPTAAPAQVETSADAPEATRADFRKGHGHRGGHGMMRHIMKKVDANGDGAVTQEEIDTFRAAIVTEADVSGEGDISLDEFETIYLEMTRERMVDAFQSLDADGDGVVTQAEMDARFGNVVERMDRNDDGKLDRDDRGGRDQKGHQRDGKRHGDRRG